MAGTPDEPASGDEPDLVLWTALVLGVVLFLAIGGQLLKPGTTQTQTTGLQVGLFAAAYVGGVLAFLSPCSVAIVPGFFAYSFESRQDLLTQTYVFYLGLSVVFVPLGFGASIFGQMLRTHQILLTTISGVAMILLGVAVLAHLDLFARLSGIVQADPSRARTTTGKTFLIGSFFGIATTSCTAPILAGITVLSLGAGLTPVLSMVLFLFFALGIATPLFVLAWAEDRAAFLDRLRGGRWQVELLGRERTLVASKVLTGAVLILLGVVFLLTNGTRSLTRAYDAVGATALYESLDLTIQQTFSGPIGWVATAAFLLVFAWLVKRRLVA